ncbi:MAG: hypothetical protein PHS44_07805 [Candidatus Dojkabacteria bacterium]|nr:hypothetical protein [Candidatus Dojkabacteria bacterium]
MMKAIIWDLNGTLASIKAKKLKPYAEEILSKASGKYLQALATTSIIFPERRRVLIRSLGIEKFFKFIKVGQKNEKLFSDICKEFRCEPKDTFVIGDGFRYGLFQKEIAIGNKLGMKTIWIDNNNKGKDQEKLREIKYWKKISHLEELDRILF